MRVTISKFLFAASFFGACLFGCGEARASEIGARHRAEALPSARFQPAGDSVHSPVGKGLAVVSVGGAFKFSRPTASLTPVLDSVFVPNPARLYLFRTGLSPPRA